jgi:DNA-binding YbaB/EbfC family protein
MAEKFDLGGLFKQAQELQGRLAAAQQAIAERSVDGSAGGGMVSVRVSGKLELLSVHIDPTLLESPDRDMLQDLVVAAVNDGIRRAQALVAEEMGKLTGGLGLKLPGLG